MAQVTQTNREASTASIQGLGWKYFTGLILAYVCYGGFFVAKSGVGFAGNGDVVRIVFFHVPIAVLSYVVYVVAWVYAFRYLKAPQRLDLDRKSGVAMEIGFLFCILATITGSIFAGAQWGNYWNWDSRETSIVIMLLLYGAYLALRGAIEDPVKRGRLAAVYVLIAIVPATFLIWVAPRITDSLHPQAVLVRPKNTSMDYKMVLYPAFIGFTMLFIWMFQLRVRLVELTERRRARRTA